MSKKFSNPRTDKFISEIPTASIELDTDTITTKCKFNFAYLDKQDPSQNPDDWSKDQLVSLINKLKDYSRESLMHWTKTAIGSSGSVLAIYDEFPTKTEFKLPKHVPHQAKWARFRLESADRLIGFVLPHKYHNVPHKKTNHYFDCNTFYIVYLDKDHKFWLTEKK